MKERLRVAQIGPMPPPFGGVATNMLAIHDALVQGGHASVIIDATNRYAESPAPWVIKPRSPMRLITTATSGDWDIIHYHIGGDFSGKLALLTLCCGLMPGKRSVVTFHSGGFAREAKESARPFSLRGAAFRSVDRLIAVNDEMVEMFRGYGVPSARIKKILPYELRRPDPSAPLPQRLGRFADAHDPLLLSIGALEPEYNHGVLIGSMPEILKRFPSAGLVIVGSGRLKRDVLAQIRDLALEDRILVEWNVEHGPMLRLIERAGVLIRLTDYDGDAISIREALHLGTPVIASDNAARPEGCILVTAHADPSELADAVMKATDRQFSGHTGPVADGGNAEKVLDLYRDLLER